MNDKLNRIESKLDQVKDELVEVKLGYQEHERRSLANEKSLELLKTKVEPVLLQINFVHKLVVLIAGVAGFIYSILEIRSLLK